MNSKICWPKRYQSKDISQKAKNIQAKKYQHIGQKQRPKTYQPKRYQSKDIGQKAKNI